MSSFARRAGDTQRNREIDALDLGADLDVLPPVPDPSFSPLAGVGRPVTSQPPQPVPDPASEGRNVRALSRPASGPGPAAQTRRRRPSSQDQVTDQVRSQRDQTRDRLVKEALASRGLDPDSFVSKALPRGGKHRPTIELTPEEYAAITVATAVRPDLFGRSLIGFIRACAASWESIAETLDSAVGGHVGTLGQKARNKPLP